MAEEDPSSSDIKSDIFRCSPSSPVAPPRRCHHRRSSTWTGSVSIPSENTFKTQRNDYLDQIRVSTDQEEAVVASSSSSSSSSSPQQKSSSNRSRLINKIRNGAEMRLDVESVSKDWFVHEQHEAGDFPLHGSDAELWIKRERMAACDKECSKILPYLYVSSRTVAQNLTLLHECRITHIINCIGYICPAYFPHEFKYKTLWLEDSPSEDILSVLFDVIDYIEAVHEQTGGRVLLHCSEGVSRAPSLVIAYLMWRRSQNFEDAFYEVKSRRNVVSPNMGFATQLMQWGNKILGLSDRYAPQMYRIAPQSWFDPLYLVPKAVSTVSLNVLDSRGAFVIRFANTLYIWKGKQCDKGMVVAAGHVAFQLIRYEHAQGPGVLVCEGSELIHMPKAWRELAEPSKDGDFHVHFHNDDYNKDREGDVHAHADDYNTCNHVAAYDSDFELYMDAQSGAYPLPCVASGVVINSPNQLHQIFSRTSPRFSTQGAISSGDIINSSNQLQQTFSSSSPRYTNQEINFCNSPRFTKREVNACNSPRFTKREVNTSGAAINSPDWLQHIFSKEEAS